MEPSFHLCIIDDDEIYRFVTIQSVKFLGMEHKSSVFSNGEDALSFISENLDKPAVLPDIILLDIDMPIMDGFQFLEGYRPVAPQIVKPIDIYMVSSSVDPEDIKRAKAYPTVVNYISKPLNSDVLKGIIEKALLNQN
ncbi:response regulator [Zobellia uliginosa]|uniref:response regulator n=1 Tax=Zobellia uliginosa TaxID=143224 RepID=UPI0026E22663|nr:response regulator [Zobellia uliginosa]MDO6517892.1 response regulator [Zobellia uliginosa]